jgi:hypothetical protein
MVDLVRPLSLPRLRLLALWTSQVAHFAGTYTLRVFVVLCLSGEGDILSGSAWHLVTALFMAPSILLGPLHGALANTLPKPLVLRIAALCGVTVAAFFTWFNDGWLLCVVLAAISSASYTPTRLALLPAAAQETGIPLNSVVGAIESGAVLAIVGGMIQGGAIAYKTLPGHPDVSAAMLVVSGWYLLSLATVSFVRFSSDKRRSQSASTALQGFFLDTVQILRNPASRGNLLAIGYLRGVATASAGAFIAASLDGAASPPFALLLRVAFVTMAGTAVGSLVATLAGDRRYAAAQVQLGAVGFTLGLAGVALFCQPSWPLCFLIGACGGLVNVPLLGAFQRALEPQMRGNAMAVLNAAGYLAMTLASALLAGLAQSGVLTPIRQFHVVAVLAAVGATAAVYYRGGDSWQLTACPRLVSKSPE